MVELSIFFRNFPEKEIRMKQKEYIPKFDVINENII